MNMYQQKIMDHYRHPRNRGHLTHADFSITHRNASCGDMITVQGTVEHGCLTKIAFQAEGCVISQSVASILSEHLEGRPIDQVQSVRAQEVTQLIGTSLGPLRMRCAVLSLEALHAGIDQYTQRVDTNAGSD